MIKAMFAIVFNPKTSHLLPFSSKRMDTVMTMEAHALTGMQTKIGAQLMQMIFGVNLRINGAMLIRLVKSHNQLFTSKILSMKVSSTGRSAQRMFAVVWATKRFQMISYKRKDTVMTMDHSALTGMQTNHGAQMLKETLRNGADPNISGAMLILSVWTQN